MKNSLNKTTLFLLFFLTITIFSCRIRKKIKKDFREINENTIGMMSLDNKNELKKELVYSLVSKNFDYNHLSLKAKGKVHSKQMGQYNIVLLFRLERNNKIWLSIQIGGIGVEIFRILIDQEKAQWINRLEHTFTVVPLSKLSPTGKNLIPIIQNILLSKLSSEVADKFLENSTLEYKENVKVISKYENIDAALEYFPDKLIRSINLEMEKTSILLNYENFSLEEVNGIGVELPHNLNINFKLKTLDINFILTLTKFTDKDNKYPFRIPNRYIEKPYN